MRIEWVFVAGGTCRYGDRHRPVVVTDLFWTITPLTGGQIGREELPDFPLTGLSHFEAIELASSLGGRLPTSVEWEWMAAGPEGRTYPWGNQDWGPTLANLLPLGVGVPVPVGSFPAGSTLEGILDVAGNVWEWTKSVVYGDGAIVRGGSYNSVPLYAHTKFLNAAPRELRSSGIGIRLVRT
jgi:sulfatase modifying factor 1